MRLSTVKTLAICLVATFSACDNKQPKANENTDSAATKDTIIAESVKPQVDSTKIFSDIIAQRRKMVYKVTRQVEDDIVYDDESDSNKSTFTESLHITFNSNGKVNIKEVAQDDCVWSGEWETNGYDVTIYTKDLVLQGKVTEDYKFFSLSSESINKLGWMGARKLKLQ